MFDAGVCRTLAAYLTSMPSMSKEKSRNKRVGTSASPGKSLDPHRKRESNKYDQPIASREFISDTLREETGPVDFETLAEKLNLIGNEVGMEALRRRVGAMIRDGQLIQNRKRGLVPVDADNLLAGRISAHPDGFGFVVVEDSESDIYLNGKQMRQVLHGDRVVVCVTGIDRRGRREGRVVDVVERANKSLVGRLSIDRGTVVVLPDNKRIHQDLLIAPNELGGASDGDMVVAEIIEQPTRRHQPVGKVIEVLGQHLRPGMEIDVALHSHGIPASWPEAVLEEAATFSTLVDPATATGRKDVRDVQMVTIDGADARDFDDAVWCEPLEKGWRLFVAIADVAHYVTLSSALDKEAVGRGTSVYFPGRVVPMLPEVLSNGLCSLNPNVDRLCMICELTLDEEGNVKKTRFHNGIMRSHARLTYDQVHEMLTEEGSALREQHAALMPVILELHSLYKVLSEKRRERGAIEFDSNETHILFDENKKISEIIPIQRNDAHKLIEECMILANIQAAAYLEEREIPALYRVHAGPKADRLEDLRAFLSLRSLGLGGGDSPTALDYADLAATIADREDRSVIQTVMLRSMQQAVYQPKNEGHFGLALDEYAHFTSPIRRYPDLLVHRALKHAIAKGKSSNYAYTTDAMVSLGESCSMTERRAEDASRDVVAWLKCEYMLENVGSEYDGVITAVTSFGLFVELTGIHVEGLLHVTNLSRDYYQYDQAAQAMIGERTGRRYRLGDPIKVKVAGVNLEDRKIDFNEAGVQSDSGDVSNRNKKPHHKQKHKHKHKSSDNQSRAQPQVPANAPQADVKYNLKKERSAEQKRQQKRKRKQERRDRKRAELRAAKRALKVAEASTDKPNKVTVEVDDDGRALQAKRNSTPKKSSVNSASARKKASGNEAVSKNSASKKVVNKKVSSEQATSDKAASKNEASKRGISEKAVSKAAPSKLTANKKAVSKKAVSHAVTSKSATKKKATSEKVVSKKAVTKKAASKAVASKNAVSKKTVSNAASSKSVAKKKAVTKKVTSKATASKKIASKTVVSKNATSRKATNKKVASKKVASKKVATKKVATKKVANKAVGAKKVANKKVATKKVASKKVASKKVASKKVASKKVASKKVASKKVASKKVASKKVASKKVASKKVASKKVATKKVTSKKAMSKKATSKKATGKKAAGKRR